jgi:hypothetical protein
MDKVGFRQTSPTVRRVGAASKTSEIQNFPQIHISHTHFKIQLKMNSFVLKIVQFFTKYGDFAGPWVNRPSRRGHKSLSCAIESRGTFQSVELP